MQFLQQLRSERNGRPEIETVDEDGLSGAVSKQNIANLEQKGWICYCGKSTLSAPSLRVITQLSSVEGLQSIFFVSLQPFQLDR